MTMANEQTPLLSTTSSTGGTIIPRHPHLGKTDIHTQFIALVGVPASNVPSSTKSSTSWPKSSLYGRATRQLRSQSFTYQFTAALSNTLLLSQVVLGAAVTGLGASASSHILITVIGALNTVIAGLVAYLKSRGQPMRARMYRDDLERVVDEIENSEVMFLGISNGVQGYEDVVVDGDVTVRSEVARLTRLYERAVRNNTANNPDSYVQGPGMDNLVAGGPRGVVPLPAVPIAAAAPPPPSPAAAVLPSSPAIAAPVAVPALVVSQDPDASPASAPPKRPDTPKPSEAASSTTTLVPPPASAANPNPVTTNTDAANTETQAPEKTASTKDGTKDDGQAHAGASATQSPSDTAPSTSQSSPQAAPEIATPQQAQPVQATPADSPAAPLPTSSAPRNPDESPASAPLRRRTTPAVLPATSESSTPAEPKTNGKNQKCAEAQEESHYGGQEDDESKDKKIEKENANGNEKLKV